MNVIASERCDDQQKSATDEWESITPSPDHKFPEDKAAKRKRDAARRAREYRRLCKENAASYKSAEVNIILENGEVEIMPIEEWKPSLASGKPTECGVDAVNVDDEAALQQWFESNGSQTEAEASTSGELPQDDRSDNATRCKQDAARRAKEYGRRFKENSIGVKRKEPSETEDAAASAQKRKRNAERQRKCRERKKLAAVAQRKASLASLSSTEGYVLPPVPASLHPLNAVAEHLNFPAHACPCEHSD